MSLSLKELCALVNVPYDRTLEEKVFSEEDEEDEEEDALCPRNISGQEQATEDVQDQVEHNESEKDDAHCSKNISGQEDAADGQDQMAHNGSELVEGNKENDVAEEALGGESRIGRPKRRTNTETWKVNTQKRRRMMGQSYLGRRQNEEVTREERKMGRPCQSVFCRKSKKLHCEAIQEADREAIFKYFWEKLDWRERKIYVVSLVDVGPVRRRRTGEEQSRRSASILCHLKVDGKRTRVCQSMFLSTLGIKQWCFLSWVGRREPEKIKKTSIRNEEVEFLQQFLKDLPKVPSHYCRSSSTKMYLEPLFKSISHLHSEYTHACAENNVQSLSRQVFSSIFNKLNLSLFHPKKDQCNTCCSYKVGNIDAGTWEEHCRKKESARVSKQEDKNNATEKTMVVCMDLQGLLLCPKLQASALYYKTKLGVHNFTMYNMATHDATNYLWHEGEGGLTANEFASCIIHFLEEHSMHDEYILWSDGCSYQNRNIVLSNALLKFATEKQKVVTQKYLEKGHTQMECDSVHSVIERRLRDRDIHVPAEYATVIRAARSNPRPYNVQYVNHSFFQDYSKLKLCKSIRPGKNPGESTVFDLRAIRYNVDGTMDYKTVHADDWTPYLSPTLRKRNSDTTVLPLYTSSLRIKALKYKHLQELKNFIPKDFHGFYDSLNYE
ncbi:uncharacterized protein LOC125780591 isoform X1 [Astyanax mexicanus]|uniref:uncharacterized protein LOC125780591 isoform X1 n=2 Tax=Astyanax mexicanus TaxID=7994 RepID=UPI0020CB458A|nr:uncharacterized protein LOC125780591 isoform X1 [Astyanax mexicanus]